MVLHDGGRTYLLEATNKRPGQALPLASRLPEYQPEAMFNRDTYWVNAGSVLTTDYRRPGVPDGQELDEDVHRELRG